jgi:hypothetical protein
MQNHGDHLFSGASWHQVKDAQEMRLREEVSQYPAEKLLNTSVEDLSAYFYEKFKFEVPVLDRSQAEADSREVQMNPSRQQRDLYGDDGLQYVTGTEFTLEIPYGGEKVLFSVRPSTHTFNPPRANVTDGVLAIRLQTDHFVAARTKAEVDRTLEGIQSALENLRNDVGPFNADLKGNARALIEDRREKLLQTRTGAASMGFKMKERSGPKTYPAPEIRRKIAPAPPKASSAPYTPEPVLDLTEYNHILDILDNMALVMERNPGAFKTLNEEDLRTHFLMQLNGHYEGAATGETFNYQGKTDILVRVDGKNIFIGECKFWGGAKVLVETIDQILGYSSWRDTKVAVLIFNQNKDFTKVLASIQEGAKAHSNFKREIGKRSEASFQYLFSHRDDPNREMIVTVMAFDVPK